MKESLLVNILSDSTDNSLVLSTVRKIQNQKSYKLTITGSTDSITEESDVYIAYIEKPNSRIVSKLLEKKKLISPDTIICVNINDAFLVSNLLKNGFSDIFVFPNESYRFTLELEERFDRKIRAGIKDTRTSDQVFDGIIGSSPEMDKIKRVAKKIAVNHDINILLLGETGTGKGLIAKAIHDYAGKNSPFVDIVCTAIPANLLESELFGHEKGAFTDAKISKSGLFELADKGTILLDEIGDLDLGLQAKLLRVIEKKVFRRLGSIKDIQITARIISATNQNLAELVEKNRFRRDLYHRLNVISLEIPPLRERKEDIPELTENFIKEFAEKFRKNITGIESDVENYILSYDWPGNIRELRHTVEKAVILEDKEKLTLKYFRKNSSSLFSSPPVPASVDNFENEKSIHLTLDYNDNDLENVSQLYAREVLKRELGNKSKTAKILGISRPKLNKLLED